MRDLQIGHREARRGHVLACERSHARQLARPRCPESIVIVDQPQPPRTPHPRVVSDPIPHTLSSRDLIEQKRIRPSQYVGEVETQPRLQTLAALLEDRCGGRRWL